MSGDLTFGQNLAMREIGEMITGILSNTMAGAFACTVIAEAIDEDSLPMNSAHIRAAGIHALDVVEQLTKGFVDDEDDEATYSEMLKELKKDIEACRAALTQ
jgi:hypothetical protein